MAIWKIAFDVRELALFTRGFMGGALGIEFTEVGDDWLKARMPLNERTLQPLNILHGGASAALAEEVASVAANLTLDFTRQFAIAMEVHTLHLKPVPKSTEWVEAVTRPLRLGRSAQHWQVWTYNSREELIATGFVVMAVREHTPETLAMVKPIVEHLKQENRLP